MRLNLVDEIKIPIADIRPICVRDVLKLPENVRNLVKSETVESRNKLQSLARKCSESAKLTLKLQADF